MAMRRILQTSCHLQIAVIIILSAAVQGAQAFGGGDKVLLKDVTVLTLYNNRQTSYRRTSPIPQLKCLGGTAGCSSYVPQVVQCYNRGSDGYDVQWECKTDMDNSFRFGQVEVSCEGYDYPEDPYVLRGSCGMEYTLDLTQEGYQQRNSGQDQGHDYYANKHSYEHDRPSSLWKKSSFMGDVVVFVIAGIVIYAIYRTCIASNDNGNDDDDGFGQPRDSRRPPPAGFRQDYMPHDQGGGCGATSGGTYGNTYQQPYTAPRRNNWGGFWGGAGMGGLLGYMLGSRTNTYQQPYHRPHGGGWGSGWGNGGLSGGSGWTTGGGSGFGSRSTGSSSSGFSSGTRTASGFGGTRRR